MVVEINNEKDICERVMEYRIILATRNRYHCMRERKDILRKKEKRERENEEWRKEIKRRSDKPIEAEEQ